MNNRRPPYHTNTRPDNGGYQGNNYDRNRDPRPKGSYYYHPTLEDIKEITNEVMKVINEAVAKNFSGIEYNRNEITKEAVKALSDRLYGEIKMNTVNKKRNEKAVNSKQTSSGEAEGEAQDNFEDETEEDDIGEE